MSPTKPQWKWNKLVMMGRDVRQAGLLYDGRWYTFTLGEKDGEFEAANLICSSQGRIVGDATFYDGAKFVAAVSVFADLMATDWFLEHHGENAGLRALQVVTEHLEGMP